MKNKGRKEGRERKEKRKEKKGEILEEGRTGNSKKHYL